MASPKRPWVAGAIYHITNRGNHQEIIFRESIDRRFRNTYNKLTKSEKNKK